LCFFVPTVYLACPIPVSPLLGTMLAYASIGAPELRLDGGITFLLYTVCDCDPSPFSGIAEEESGPRTALLQPPTLSSIVYRVLQRRIVSCLELMVASSSSKLNRDAILFSHTMYRHWLGAKQQPVTSIRRATWAQPRCNLLKKDDFIPHVLPAGSSQTFHPPRARPWP
jgi:hypothetical protein